MASIFDNPAPALFQNPRYAGLLTAYDPLEEAFRKSYAPPAPSTNIYKPGQAGNIPGAPQQPVYPAGPASLSIWDGGNGAGSQAPGPPGAAPSPNDVSSVMGPMDPMSPASIGLGIMGMVNPAVGAIGTLGKIANMVGPPANISPDVIAMINDPVALNNFMQMMDPDGTVAIAPPTNHPLFDVVVAQQHAASQAPSPVSAEDQEAVGAIGIDVGNTGDGASSSGSTVICTELHRRGWLDYETYRDDAIFGLRQTDVVIAGYHLWAKPYVRLMQRPGILGALATALAVAIALPWAKAMRASVRGQRGPVFGRAIMAVGLPICRWLGRDRGRAVSTAGRNRHYVG